VRLSPFAVSRVVSLFEGKKMRIQLGIVIVIAQVLAGCAADAGRAPVPTAPSSPTPPPSAASVPQPWPPGPFAPNVTLSGVVFEIVQDAEVPIERVWVYCELCGEETHSGTYTDNKGFYTFKGVWGNAVPILVAKDGYQDPPGTTYASPFGPGSRDVIVNGDTRFNIQLARK
jgi:hypothetical protein